jgi:hypothetical protein
MALQETKEEVGLNLQLDGQWRIAAGSPTNTRNGSHTELNPQGMVRVNSIVGNNLGYLFTSPFQQILGTSKDSCFQMRGATVSIICAQISFLLGHGIC